MSENAVITVDCTLFFGRYILPYTLLGGGVSQDTKQWGLARGHNFKPLRGHEYKLFARKPSNSHFKHSIFYIIHSISPNTKTVLESNCIL